MDKKEAYRFVPSAFNKKKLVLWVDGSKINWVASMAAFSFWEDGRKFPIDRVMDVRQAASLKAGGQGMRYTCRIAGKEVYLFCDEGKWFLER